MQLVEAPRWTIDVERGPDWLFVRLHAPDWTTNESGDLAKVVWQTMQQHFARRIVLEMQDVDRLHSQLIGQLVLLQKRIQSTGGILRICGLSASNIDALRATRLNDRFPCYWDREDAVMGRRAAKPR